MLFATETVSDAPLPLAKTPPPLLVAEFPDMVEFIMFTDSGPER